MKLRLLWLRLVSALVPGALRPGWAREWRAELAARQDHSRVWKAASEPAQSTMAGMLMDALWLRAQSVREGVWLDLRLAIRSFLRRPLGGLLAAMVVAGAVAATVLVFALVDSILLRPLPYPASDSLVRVQLRHPAAAPNGDRASRADLVDLRRHSAALSHVAGWYVTPRTVRAGTVVEVLSVAQVSADFFPALRVLPAMGRTFTPEESAEATFSSSNSPTGADPKVVISHGYWQRRFAGEADALGATIELGGRDWRVIGVMPAGFAFPDRTIDAWIAWSFRDAAHRDQRYLFGLGRIEEGRTLEAAREDAAAVGVELAERYPESNRDWSMTIEPLIDSTVATGKIPLRAGVVAVLAVLLLALLDVAMLQWVRGHAVLEGYAVRRALGSSRGRLFRTMLAEMSLPAVLGAVLGGLVAWTSVEWLAGGSSWLQLPRMEEVAWTAGTTWFWLGCLAVVPLLTALPTALRVLRLQVAGGGGWSGSRSPSQNRRFAQAVGAVVVVEIAVAMALVLGSSSLLQSWARLVRVDPGFDAEHVLVAPMILEQGTAGGRGSRAFHEGLREHMERVPGVVSAGGATVLPMAPIGPDFSRPVFLPGATIAGEAIDRSSAPQADVRMATPGLFETLQIPVLAGRDFELRDGPEAGRVVLINASLAGTLYPAAPQHAIGESIVIDYSEYDYSATVVGVVGDVLQSGLQGQPQPSVYIPHAQRPYLIMNLAVRVDPARPASLETLQAAILDFDPDQPPHSVTPLSSLVAGSIDRERLTGGWVSLFGLVALALAALGLYGVLAAAVSARRPELGIRLALGARPRDLEALVLRRSFRLLAVGAVLGVVLSLGLGWMLAVLLYGTRMFEPLTAAASIGALAVAVLVASWLPARSAGRTRPRRWLGA